MAAKKIDLAKKLEAYQKLIADSQPQPCRTCGACPTCGSQPVRYVPPVYPYWHYYPNTVQPYPNRTITWDTDTAAPNPTWTSGTSTVALNPNAPKTIYGDFTNGTAAIRTLIHKGVGSADDLNRIVNG